MEPIPAPPSLPPDNPRPPIKPRLHKKALAIISYLSYSFIVMVLDPYTPIPTEEHEPNPTIQASVVTANPPAARIPHITLNTPTNLSDWKTYEEPELNISIQYPSFITVTSDYNPDVLGLSIHSQTLAEVTHPTTIPISFYSPQEFVSDYYALKQKLYGRRTGFSRSESHKLYTINNITIKTYLTLGQFDVEDVMFLQSALFYPDEETQVFIILTGPRNTIITENPSYFKDGAWIYQDNPNYWSQDEFIIDLVDGKTGPISQKWYHSFDEILTTIQVNSSQ
jgi:hypothetical protein